MIDALSGDISTGLANAATLATVLYALWRAVRPAIRRVLEERSKKARQNALKRIVAQISLGKAIASDSRKLALQIRKALVFLLVSFGVIIIAVLAIFQDSFFPVPGNIFLPSTLPGYLMMVAGSLFAVRVVWLTFESVINALGWYGSPHSYREAYLRNYLRLRSERARK